MRRIFLIGWTLTVLAARWAAGEGPPLVLAVVGDYGNCDVEGKTPERCSDPAWPEVRVAEMVKSWRPQAIFTVGDDSYVAGSTAEVRFAQLPYADYVKRGVFFPSWGNHDWGHGHRRPATLDPSFEYFGIHEYYYTHEFPGLMTAYLLDTNPEDPHGDTAESAQAAWFRTALQKSTTPWNIAFNHQAPYVSCGHKSSKEFRWIGEPQVDIAFSGHSHVYERLIEPHTDGKGTLPYVVVGTGGADLNKPSDCRTPPEAGHQKYVVDHYGALKLEVTSHQIVGTYYTLDGGVQDSFTLNKP